MKTTVIKTDGVVVNSEIDFNRYGYDKAFIKLDLTNQLSNLRCELGAPAGKSLKIILHGSHFETSYTSTGGTETEKTVNSSQFAFFIAKGSKCTLEIQTVQNLSRYNIRDVNTELYNSIDQFYQMSNLTNLEFGDTCSEGGDLTPILKANQTLTIIQFRSKNIYGDLSYLGNATTTINISDNGGTFTWSGNKYLTHTFNCNRIRFADSASMDLFLQDMAELTVQGTSINLAGTRTSASDAAVATLTANGVTVNITE